jgi:hypothetical protein
VRQPVARIVTGQPDGPGDCPGPSVALPTGCTGLGGAPYWEASAATALCSRRRMAAAITASVLVVPEPRGEGRRLRTTLPAKLG